MIVLKSEGPLNFQRGVNLVLRPRSCTPPLFIFNNYQPIANEFTSEFHEATTTSFFFFPRLQLCMQHPSLKISNACVRIQSTFSFNATYFLFSREETPMFMTSRGSHESENSPTQESWTHCRGVCGCRSRWWKLALLQRLCCSGGRAPQTLRLPDQSDVDQLLPT